MFHPENETARKNQPKHTTQRIEKSNETLRLVALQQNRKTLSIRVRNLLQGEPPNIKTKNHGVHMYI